MIKRIIYKLILLHVTVLAAGSFSLNAAEEPLEIAPQRAYEKGTLLFQQNKYTEAKPFLSQALDHGYPSAGLMLADIYKTNIFVQTKKEAKYLLKAAELGNFIAMFRLGGSRSIHTNSKEWDEKVIPEIKRFAKNGSPYAMRLMHALATDEEESDQWLKKAADAGDAYSQHKLAKRYKNGEGWFLIPGKREREVERLFKASADSGYREGMLSYAYHLLKNGNDKEYKEIFDRLLELGDAKVILALSINYLDDGKYDLAAYYSKIYLMSMGGEELKSSYRTVQSVYDEAIIELNEEQISFAHDRAEDYLATHTVHYQKRIEEYEYTLESLKQQIK
ncbi:tetratricopeptide repeat protein, partial [Vibrio panuliri]|uniref:tetratricopeptide repeat protein n=1 Tax=Vibrio panuliri TaxID=1381081 RepID=UPI001C0BEB2D